MGKSGDINNLLANQQQLKDKNATFIRLIEEGYYLSRARTNSWVSYLRFRRTFYRHHKYLRLLEEMVILTLAEYGIKAERSKGETGVWLDVGTPFARKICAMGVRASRWVTMHGFALNVNANLGYFDLMIPCGIKDKAVTSLNVELGVETVAVEEVKQKLRKHFSALFEAEFI